MKTAEQFRPNASAERVAPPIVHQALRSPGRPLSPEIRGVMEPRFGHDFAHVRVHTDDVAAQSADAIGARAFATGRDIVFARNQFSPGSNSGGQLLAHELAHTVQQRNAAASQELPLSEPGSGIEREAESAASAAQPAKLTRSGPIVARQPAPPPAAKTAPPTNRQLAEQALSKFLKAVQRAFPKETLAQNTRVVTECGNLALVAQRFGPVSPGAANIRAQKMKEFLNTSTAPRDAEALAKAVAQRLQGDVPQAAIDRLNDLNVFKPNQDPSVADQVAGAFKGADDRPAEDEQKTTAARQQSQAAGAQSNSPTMIPLQPNVPTIADEVQGAVDRRNRRNREAEKADRPSGGPAPDYEVPARPEDKAAAPVAPAVKTAPTADRPSQFALRPIHFEINRPAAPASDDKTLRASLTRTGVGDFEGVLGWLQRHPEFGVELSGSASIEGPPEHNVELGRNRAQSVANALVSAGIAANRIADVPGLPAMCAQVATGIHNCGDSHALKPANSNDRRVDARLYVRPEAIQKP